MKQMTESWKHKMNQQFKNMNGNRVEIAVHVIIL